MVGGGFVVGMGVGVGVGIRADGARVGAEVGIAVCPGGARVGVAVGGVWTWGCRSGCVPEGWWFVQEVGEGEEAGVGGGGVGVGERLCGLHRWWVGVL